MYKIIDNEGVPALADTDGEIHETHFFKTPFNHNTLDEARAHATYCLDKSKTDQSFVEDADINAIVTRAGLNLVPEVPLPEHFGVDNRIDLYTARCRIAESNATFYNLPAAVREEFENSPARWEQQVFKLLDKGDVDELNRMGIDVRKPPVAPKEGISSPEAPGGAGGTVSPPETPQKTDTAK